MYLNGSGRVVPERELEALAAGIEGKGAEIHRHLSLMEDGEGAFKFLRGGGHAADLHVSPRLLGPQNRGFAAIFVVVSDNDLHFHKFDDLYRKVFQELGTAALTGRTR